MNIKDSITIGSKAANEVYTAKSRAKENQLATGQKAAEQISEDAVALSISAKAGGTGEAALENANAAASAVTDVFKAEEMIREANKRILEQADDAVLAQANQTAIVTTELLK